MYTLKSGILYQEPDKEELVNIKSSLCGPGKKIYRGETDLLLTTDIHYPENKRCDGDVRNKEYTLTSSDGSIVGVARPDYSDEDNPDVAGWPICHMPKVDRASVTVNGTHFIMLMHNNRSYGMQNDCGQEVVQIRHNGIAGGWSIEDGNEFAPEVVCGLFVFCRYIEKENEFPVV
jgi:hypothetical protein